jgi:hypothetical protein
MGKKTLETSTPSRKYERSQKSVRPRDQMPDSEALSPEKLKNIFAEPLLDIKDKRYNVHEIEKPLPSTKLLQELYYAFG